LSQLGCYHARAARPGCNKKPGGDASMGHMMRLVALLLVALSGPAWAQGSYPDKPVRMVAPFTAGGPVDIVARIVANGLTEIWKQQVVVENRTGAGGNIGAEAVAKSAPDGYTLLLTSPSFVLAPAVYKKIGFRPLEDFVPLSKVADTVCLFITAPNLPANSVADVVKLAKASPGKYSFASPGQGTSLHLAFEMFKKAAGIDVVHVPYRGGAAALPDMMAGEPHLMITPAVDTLAHVKAGKLKALAVSTKARAAILPELPTIAETVPGYEFSLWYAAFAPAGTPPAVAAKISRDIGTVLAQPAVKERFEGAGIRTLGVGTDVFKEEMRQEIQTWTELAQAIGLSLE
jgi:tripartite-type tricarboxylate transporter receptor subunit TctC